MFGFILQLSVELFHRLQQGIYMLEVMIVRHATSHVLPDFLLRVQFWRVGWQPFKLNPVSVLLQQLENGFCLMRLVIVHKENNSPLWMSRQSIGSRNGSQQSPESNVVPTLMDHRHRLSCDGVHCTPVPALRCTHAGRQNDSLLSNARPTAGDRWEQTHLGRISKQKDLFWTGLSFPVSDLFFSLQPGQGLAYA